MQREKKTLPNLASFLHPDQRRHTQRTAAKNEALLGPTWGSFAPKVCTKVAFYGTFCLQVTQVAAITWLCGPEMTLSPMDIDPARFCLSVYM